MMAKYIEPYILIILGIIACDYKFADISDIIRLLCAIIVVSLLQVIRYEKMLFVFILLSAVGVLFFPETIAFFPAVIYFGIYSKYYTQVSGLFLLILSFSTRGTFPSMISPLILGLLSLYMAYNTQKNNDLNKKVIDLRDSSVEREIELNRKNKQLMEMQHDQIHLATMTERNRIAREIHDNVGHLLSRAIIQAGSINAITTDQQIKPFMGQLKDTLDDAMNNIRNSVHDLHDESIDLNSSIKSLCDSFEFCPVDLHCETSSQVPRDVKYCFITIAKEALNNISKHSNASKASIYIHEHPGFFQLLIEDNGTKSSQSDTNGIGLTNMKDRVTALGGVITINNESGFRIFISIPKNRQ